ncbi:MAG: ABC transporter permease [SAR202 cluster bacterium]|nr:ABC transporter permease [SAR202 cluster bacterium]
MQFPAALRRAQSSAINLTAPPIARSVAGIALALVSFGAFLLVIGRNPLSAYATLFTNTLASPSGLSEVAVFMIPFVLTGLAAAVPARVGLINVGGEGQLYLGAWAATGIALFSGIGTPWLMLPLMVLAGFAGGAAWAGIAILLRRWRNVNEVICTLLLNFVAILFVNIFVFGPWKNTGGYGYPYTADFSPAAILPALGDFRLHWGLVLPLLGVVVCYVVINHTRWGYNMRAVGGNVEAARRRGIGVGKYLLLAMLAGGGLAGIAGMSEVAGIQHHLRPGISSEFGYLGFLASWLAGHNPLALLGTAFLLAAIFVAGDLLQISAGLPSAAIFILIGLVLFMVLGLKSRGRAQP